MKSIAERNRIKKQSAQHVRTTTPIGEKICPCGKTFTYTIYQKSKVYHSDKCRLDYPQKKV